VLVSSFAALSVLLISAAVRLAVSPRSRETLRRIFTFRARYKSTTLSFAALPCARARVKARLDFIRASPFAETPGRRQSSCVNAGLFVGGPTIAVLCIRRTSARKDRDGSDREITLIRSLVSPRFVGRFTADETDRRDARVTQASSRDIDALFLFNERLGDSFSIHGDFFPNNNVSNTRYYVYAIPLAYVMLSAYRCSAYNDYFIPQTRTRAR